MKTLTIIMLMIALALKVNAHVALDKPMGEGSYNPGDNIIVEWHIVQSHPQNNWDLFYSVDGGITWKDLVLDLPNSQFSYTWTIPDIMTSAAQIKIVMDNEGANYEDISDSFRIGSDVITAIETAMLTTPSVNVYPNPFTSEIRFQIQLVNPSVIKLSVFDKSGRTIFSVARPLQGEVKQTIYWQPMNLPKGFYYYTLSSKNIISSGKLLYR